MGQNLHPFDHYTHAVSLPQHPDKATATVRAQRLKTWGHLGSPALQQFDNAAAFRGGPPQPRSLGQGVPLCLFVAVVFIPGYEAKRNHWVEGFHALWVQALWPRHRLASWAEVQAEVPTSGRARMCG